MNEILTHNNFYELTIDELDQINGGKVEWLGVLVGIVEIGGGVVTCATGAGAVTGGVSIYTGFLTILDSADL